LGPQLAVTTRYSAVELIDALQSGERARVVSSLNALGVIAYHGPARPPGRLKKRAERFHIHLSLSEAVTHEKMSATGLGAIITRAGLGREAFIG
jgi:hypothetical protein